MKKLIRIIPNIQIEKLVFKGYGLGFENFRPVFVLNAVPGDILDVKIINQKKDVLFGQIHRIIKSSKFRIKPECDVFGKCGGCDWLNISYQEQLRFKQVIITEIFHKIQRGKIDQIISSPNQFYYRNKSFLPLAELNNEPIIGMFERNSHRVISHHKCFIQPEIFDQISSQFLVYIKQSKASIYNEIAGKGTIRHLGFRISQATSEILVIIVTRSSKLPFTKQLVRTLTGKFPQITGIIQNINPARGNKILGNKEKILFGKSFLEDQLGNIKFQINYLSFFQVNNGTAEKMYAYIQDNIKENSNVIDAYSGIGAIGLFISQKAKKVFCVENNEQAVLDAEYNARRNNIRNCKFFKSDVEKKVSEFCDKKKINTIIFDPPRKGLKERIIKTVSKNKIEKVIYVSCNPSTQVRDVVKFIENGYQIEKIQPFDMFPQTYHIENVIILERDK